MRQSLNLKSMASNRGLESSRHLGTAHDQHSMAEAFKSGGSAMGDHELAVADDFLPAESVGSMPKTKARRASEGSHLTKGEGKRSSGELRCEKCGKGYKHSSCLTKHLSVFSGPLVISCLLLPCTTSYAVTLFFRTASTLFLQTSSAV